MFRWSLFTFLLFAAFVAKADITLVSNEAIKATDFFASIDFLREENLGRKSNIAISFGDEGFKQAFADESGSFDYIIALLVTRYSYSHISQSQNVDHVIPIFIDPPIDTQIYLASLLYSESAKVLVPYRGDNFSSDIKNFKNIQLLKVENTRRWLRFLDSNVDVVISHSDEEIFNGNNITSISKSLYRRNIGLIGFAPNMTNMGAVASVFSDYRDVVEVTREVLTTLDKQGQIQDFKFGRVKRYRVTVNKPLANTLGLVAVDASNLEEKINNFVGGIKE